MFFVVRVFELSTRFFLPFWVFPGSPKSLRVTLPYLTLAPSTSQSRSEEGGHRYKITLEMSCILGKGHHYMNHINDLVSKYL